MLAIPAHAQIKQADLAGKWYSSSPQKLRSELNSYLEKAHDPPIEGKVIAIISPHAGYQFSGPVAAYGFKAAKKRDIKLAVIVGFSHRQHLDAIAVLDEDGYNTPLGTVDIDRDITNQLIKSNPKISNIPRLFPEENSIEMEIPFLQMVLKDFKLVLIVIGNQSLENCRITGEALYDALKDKDKFLLIASTDMSHYLHYATANKLDAKTISLIEEFNPENLYAESLRENHRLMCGYGAVCATMIAAKKLGARRIEVLKYANSGDTAGGRKRVVGYLSAAIVNQSTDHSPQSTDLIQSTKGENDMLNEAQRKKMLELARDSITHYLSTGKKLEVKEDDPALNREMGAFVTLHEHGALRGCIGNMIGRGPFYLTVRDMAVEAATRDPRFRPVGPDEMKGIDIEISALSPLEKIDDPDKIVMGKHGVIVKQGFLSGVYLPQVATETGWDREQFMDSLCGQKAGMSSDAWKKGTCDIYIFTAEVFGEKNE